MHPPFSKIHAAFLLHFIVSDCSIKYDFSNCKSFAPPLIVDDIKIIQTAVENGLHINMKIQWKLPKAGKNVTRVYICPMIKGKQALVFV